MASLWRRTMLYLGLGPDDEYEEYEMAEEPEPPPGYRYGPAGPPEPEPPQTNLRPAQREPEPTSPPPPPARPRGSVVRPIVTQPTPKPHAVSPESFNEAQEVADRFMAGVPVIVNLQGVDRELSRRLVDFASGLCYGLGGQMDRVTNQVYLLTPSNVQMSDEEKRRVHERTS